MSSATIQIGLVSLVAMILPPMAAMTVFGQADLVVKVGDEVVLEVPVDQIDSTVSQLNFHIPFPSSMLEYNRWIDSGFAGGQTSVEIEEEGGISRLNVEWAGTAGPGSSGVLGRVYFNVKAAEDIQIQFVGESPIARDIDGNIMMASLAPDGTEIPPVIIEPSGIVRVVRRSIRIMLQILMGE